MFRNEESQGMDNRDWLLLAPFALVLLIWYLVSWSFPLFWDNVLNGKIATWYLQRGFSQLTVPERMDAGHPPFFNLYLAGWWKLLGRSLWVAHLSMLPFLGLLFWQYFKLVRRWVPRRWWWMALLLLLCEPTFWAQASMVSPDVALVAFFLTSLNLILEGRRGLLALSLIAMAAVTFRGILAVPAIFLADVATGWWAGRRQPQWLKAWPYVPVTLLTLLWLYIHYQAAGWLFSPPPETYGTHREVLGFTGILKNAAILAWRLLDYGRIALFGMALGLAWRHRSGLFAPGKLRENFVFFLLPILTFGALFLPFSNPIGHRYFLVGYLLLIPFLVQQLALLKRPDLAKWLGLAVGLTLVSGHFWVYPKTVAQGWDASAAHTTYFSKMAAMRTFMQANGISHDQVCTDFPMLGSTADTWITDDPEDAFLPLLDSTSVCTYILYSNISNGFSDELILNLETENGWKKVHEEKGLLLSLELYEQNPR